MTRFGCVMATYFATLGDRRFRASFIRAPRLIWNASASVPIGLYRRASGRRAARHRAGRGAAADAARELPRRARLSAAAACRC